MHAQHRNPSWDRFETCQIQKEIKYFFFFIFIHCFYFYSVDVAFVLNTTINIFFSHIIAVNYHANVFLDRLL